MFDSGIFMFDLELLDLALLDLGVVDTFGLSTSVSVARFLRLAVRTLAPEFGSKHLNTPRKPSCTSPPCIDCMCCMCAGMCVGMCAGVCWCVLAYVYACVQQTTTCMTPNQPQPPPTQQHTPCPHFPPHSPPHQSPDMFLTSNPHQESVVCLVDAHACC